LFGSFWGSFSRIAGYTLKRRTNKNRPALGRLFYHVLGYTNIGNYARSLVFIRVLNQLPFFRWKKIMDLGCGYGEYSVLMADLLPDASITAIDIDPERCRSLSQTLANGALKNRINVLCSMIEDTPAVESYDYVFSVDVFEHIKEDQMPFAAVYQRLKPGGHFMVKIPNIRQRTIFPEKWFEEHQHWLEAEHVGQIYDLEGLKARFEREGFRVLLAESTDGIVSRFAWELAWLGKKGGFITQLISLPISKGLIKLDPLFHKGTKGNAIHVVGTKPF